MHTVHKAGAIVISQDDPTRIALLYRAKQKDWTFPKGHVEQGEANGEASLREVTEETGLPVRLIDSVLPTMEYTHPSGDYVIVHMYLMQSEDDSNLKHEFEGDKIAWVDFKDVAAKLSYENIKQYYDQVFSVVEKTIAERKSAP